MFRDLQKTQIKGRLHLQTLKKVPYSEDSRLHITQIKNRAWLKKGVKYFA